MLLQAQCALLTAPETWTELDQEFSIALGASKRGGAPTAWQSALQDARLWSV